MVPRPSTASVKKDCHCVRKVSRDCSDEAFGGWPRCVTRLKATRKSFCACSKLGTRGPAREIISSMVTSRRTPANCNPTNGAHEGNR